MATLDSTRSAAFHAASRALDAAIDSVVEGVDMHASGTTFVPADVVNDERIARYRKTGPVTIVDAEGNQVRLERDHSARQLVLVAVVAGMIAWALARRPGVPA
jgi:hypothetical protein